MPTAAPPAAAAGTAPGLGARARRRAARRRWSTTRRCWRIRSCSRQLTQPRGWRWRTRACRRSCGRGCSRCASRVRASSPHGEAERRRIERNLHDGAQQTLLGTAPGACGSRATAGTRAPSSTRSWPRSTPSSRARSRSCGRSRAACIPPVLSRARRARAGAGGAGAPRDDPDGRWRAAAAGRLPPVRSRPRPTTWPRKRSRTSHKHAQRRARPIDVAPTDGQAVSEVAETAAVGADPLGSGLRGLRDRVEALDGTLRDREPRRRGAIAGAR